MNDEEAINYLSNLRQIGRWSAEMILLFTYNRSNIWPIQDIGLLRAISKNYKKKYLPPEKFVNLLKKKIFTLLFSSYMVSLEKYRSRTYSVLNPSITCMCLVVVSLAKSQPAWYSFES